MGQALYRQYRSRSLNEIVGQEHITSLLARAIANGNVAHAYLLTGPRGVGKTSIARILAHEINSLPYTDESVHLDIIEIDAASNNSVEDIRDLRNKVMIAPTSAPKKIYIIDEVHMLSKSAFNALLKTLEEPPEHVVFILATTDADKLPATIISRVQRFNFRTISNLDAVAHLRTIADKEHILIDDEALELVARHGKGSFRDSISLLDQLRNLSDDTITPALVETILGLADDDTVQTLVRAYERKDIATIAAVVNETEAKGTPAIVLAEQLIATVRDQIVEKPHLLPLLDALLDINRSSWPHVKLLTALASGVTSVPPTIPAPTTKVTPKADTQEVQPVTVESPPKKTTPQKEVALPTHDPAQPFPWTDFLAHIKPSSQGVYTLLANCPYEFDGQTLTIYAGKPFTKKQIDKSLTHLADALQFVGVTDGTITVLPKLPPVKDSQAAAILDIMGGGEEVTL